MYSALLEEITSSIVLGDRDTAVKSVTRASREISPWELLKQALMPAMMEVGRRMQRGEVFVPEVILSARAMKESMRVLEPFMQESELGFRGTVVIGTVEGDMHDIGKNLVCTMLRGVGFSVVDLGIDVPTSAFIDAVREHKPTVLAMSALLSNAVPEMKGVVEALCLEGIRKDIKVFIGGAAVNTSHLSWVGADCYGRDAGEAVELALKLT